MGKFKRKFLKSYSNVIPIVNTGDFYICPLLTGLKKPDFGWPPPQLFAPLAPARAGNDQLRARNHSLRVRNDSLSARNRRLRPHNCQLRSRNDLLCHRNDRLRVRNCQLHHRNDSLSTRNAAH